MDVELSLVLRDRLLRLLICCMLHRIVLAGEKKRCRLYFVIIFGLCVLSVRAFLRIYTTVHVCLGFFLPHTVHRPFLAVLALAYMLLLSHIYNKLVIIRTFA